MPVNFEDPPPKKFKNHKGPPLMVKNCKKIIVRLLILIAQKKDLDALNAMHKTSALQRTNSEKNQEKLLKLRIFLKTRWC